MIYWSTRRPARHWSRKITKIIIVQKNNSTRNCGVFLLEINNSKGVDCVSLNEIYFQKTSIFNKYEVAIDEGFFAYFFHLVGKK